MITGDLHSVHSVEYFWVLVFLKCSLEDHLRIIVLHMKEKPTQIVADKTVSFLYGFFSNFLPFTSLFEH